jgi:hypothetical protein
MKSIATAVACSVVVFTGSSAFAQNPPGAAASIDFRVAKPSEGPKSVETAKQLAVAGSLLGPAIAGVGFFAGGRANRNLVAVGLGVSVFAPSAGRWYADEVGTGLIAVRATGGAVVAAGLLYYAFGEYCTSFCFKSEQEYKATELKSGGTSVMLAGAAIVIAGSIFDIATTGDAVRRYNQKHSALSTLKIAPMIQPATSSRGTVTGLSMTGSF